MNYQGSLLKSWRGGGGEICDGLVSHPGGSIILLVTSCYGNWDKLWLDRPFSSSAEFILMLLPSFLGMPHSMIHVFYLLMNLMLCVQREETMAMNKRTGLLLSF